MTECRLTGRPTYLLGDFAESLLTCQTGGPLEHPCLQSPGPDHDPCPCSPTSPEPFSSSPWKLGAVVAAFHTAASAVSCSTERLPIMTYTQPCDGQCGCHVMQPCGSHVMRAHDRTKHPDIVKGTCREVLLTWYRAYWFQDRSLAKAPWKQVMDESMMETRCPENLLTRMFWDCDSSM